MMTIQFEDGVSLRGQDGEQAFFRGFTKSAIDEVLHQIDPLVESIRKSSYDEGYQHGVEDSSRED